MKKIIVLGAGMVGRAMAVDLAKNYRVTAADVNPENLKILRKKHRVETVVADLSLPQKIRELIAGFDLVVGAVPGFMGFSTLKTVIEAGKDIVDISFMPEDALELDDLAKQKSVVAVVDCGVAPGMSNMILGYHHQRMEMESFDCMVGGLPVVRSWPYEYKAPFSPVDVLEEYTRPARMKENGAVVIKPALSEPELVEFDNIGTLEAFNTDGLRSLLTTIGVPNMRERTLRYPGHAALMRILRESGFLDDELMDIKGGKVRPVDVTAKLLFPRWKLHEDEEEFTVMRVEISGTKNGKPKHYVYDLFDRYDKTTWTSSMARTTGYTCTAVANLVLKRDFTRIGISPPEYVGAEEKCFKKVMGYLEERGVEYNFTSHPL